MSRVVFVIKPQPKLYCSNLLRFFL